MMTKKMVPKVAKPYSCIQDQEAAGKPLRPSVVIGVCTYKRNDRLQELIKSLNSQTGPIEADVSLLIVDNNQVPSVSHDLVGSDTHFPYQILHERKAGLANARNRLFETADASGAEWLIGVDDDELLETSWLSEWIRGINSASREILIGEVSLEYPINASPYIPRRPIAKPDAPKKSFVLGTGNYAVSQKVFSQDRGIGMRFSAEFNEIGGEDAEMILRAKRQHGLAYQRWPYPAVREEQRGDRLKLRYHLTRAIHTQRNGFHIAALHRRNKTLKNATPLAVMLTRRTSKSLVRGVSNLSVGVFWLPFERKTGQQKIGIGLEHLARAWAIIPFVLGIKRRRYGASEP
ncbi:glycosyltransferase family 2 protein [Yoonia algicola]|uniref:Glycosyltransferase n=1 Tax=Yoonia algicola TaxID=3137368 RepID=A0AAN0NJA8_9RHOB